MARSAPWDYLEQPGRDPHGAVEFLDTLLSGPWQEDSAVVSAFVRGSPEQDEVDAHFTMI